MSVTVLVVVDVEQDRHGANRHGTTPCCNTLAIQEVHEMITAFNIPALCKHQQPTFHKFTLADDRSTQTTGPLSYDRCTLRQQVHSQTTGHTQSKCDMH